MPEPTHYLSRTEVAALLGVLPRSLGRTKLPPADVTVGDVRGWSEATIRKWMKQRPGRGRAWPEPDRTDDHQSGGDDVVEALVGLGFVRSEAKQAVSKVMTATPDADTATALRSALAMFDKTAA